MFPWERLDGRPLVYASLGTLQNGVESIFREIVEACSGLGVQLVLSLGGSGIALEQIQATDRRALIVPFAPQLELLRRASLCITHAGLNTVLEALSQGVPIVAVPITNDQPGVAARAAWSGTGKVVPFKGLKAEALRAAIKRVLEDPRYRANAPVCKPRFNSSHHSKLPATLWSNSFEAKFSRMRDPRLDWLLAISTLGLAVCVRAGSEDDFVRAQLALQANDLAAEDSAYRSASKHAAMH